MAWTLSRTCSATLQKINRGGCLPLIIWIKKAITSQTVKTSAEPGRWLKTWEKSEKECLPSIKGSLSPVRQTSRKMIGSSVNWEKAQREKWGRLGKGHDRQNWWKRGLNSSFFQVALLPLLFHIQSWAESCEDQENYWMFKSSEKRVNTLRTQESSGQAGLIQLSQQPTSEHPQPQQGI